MAQCRVKEVFVLGEKCNTAHPMERRDNLRVLRSELGNVGPNLPYADPPMLEQGQLVVGKVFVQQVQAAAKACRFSCGRRTGCLYRASKASCASRTASVTAAVGMRPPQRVLQINSHERPSATSSSTCQTIIRVPLNVGFPWQISGSATMYWPSSIRLGRRCKAWLLPFFITPIYAGRR